MAEEKDLKSLSRIEIEELIQTIDIQSQLKLARAILIDFSATIKKQWLECNEDETEDGFSDEDYDDLQSAIIVLEDYIHQ